MTAAPWWCGGRRRRKVRYGSPTRTMGLAVLCTTAAGFILVRRWQPALPRGGLRATTSSASSAATAFPPSAVNLQPFTLGPRVVPDEEARISSGHLRAIQQNLGRQVRLMPYSGALSPMRSLSVSLCRTPRTHPLWGPVTLSRDSQKHAPCFIGARSLW